MRQVKTPERFKAVSVHYRNWWGFKRTNTFGQIEPDDKTIDVYVCGLLTAKQAQDICEYVLVKLAVDECDWKRDNDIQDSVTYDSVSDMSKCLDCEHEDARKCPDADCSAKPGKDYGCEILTFVSNNKDKVVFSEKVEKALEETKNGGGIEIGSINNLIAEINKEEE